MRVGVVGCGRMGEFHAATCLADERVRRLDIVDPLGLTDALRSNRTSWSERLDGRIDQWDAAIVATSTDQHLPTVRRLLDAGVPVLCEKPASLHPERTVELAELASARGVGLRSGLQRRFDAAFTLARSLVREGRLGSLLWVHSSTRDPSPPPAAYLRSSGGVFVDMHVHDIDMVSWVLDSPIATVGAFGSAESELGLPTSGDFGVTTLSMQTASGVMATVTGSRWSPSGYITGLTVLGLDAEVNVGPDGEVVLHADGKASVLSAGIGRNPSGFVHRFSAAYSAEVRSFLESPMSSSGASWMDDASAVAVAREAAVAAQSTGARRDVGWSSVKRIGPHQVSDSNAVRSIVETETTKR